MVLTYFNGHLLVRIIKKLRKINCFINFNLKSSLLSVLFPAKTLFCRELWFHPKKNCVRLSLSSLSSLLTESSPGFKALPIIRLS